MNANVIRIRFSILQIIFLFSVGAFADTQYEQQLQALAAHPQWHLLLHYRSEGLLGAGFKSQLDGKDFFFASDGKTNPLAELRATITAFTSDTRVGRLQQHPICAFPERLRFLQKHLLFSLPPVDCSKLDEFMAKFDGQSVTLAFSTAYANNPGSMFGHTFLRINSRPKDGGVKRMDLLDYVLSFAAVVPPEQDGGLLFAVLGVFGGYRGQFTMLPYYAKVN